MSFNCRAFVKSQETPIEEGLDKDGEAAICKARKQKLEFLEASNRSLAYPFRLAIFIVIITFGLIASIRA